MFNRCLININRYSLILLQTYGSHLSHLSEKPSISIEKLRFLMEKPDILIKKPSFLMWKPDLDRKTKYLKLKNQVFWSPYRKTKSSNRKTKFFHQPSQNHIMQPVLIQWSMEKTCVLPPSSSHLLLAGW